MGRFHTASEEDILAGKTTDVYFERADAVLRGEGKADTPVIAEVTAGSLPDGWEWGVFCGLEEALHLLRGRDVTLSALPEGTVFRPRTSQGVRVPVLVLEGPYSAFTLLETPLLGLLCQATAVATKASRVKKRAGDAEVISFGIRRMHPAVAPMIDRAAFVGGLDGVSGLTGAEAIGEDPRGTMPHALTIVLGNPRKAFEALDRHLPQEVPRIALADTYWDEVAEAVEAAEAVPNLAGVRLDTPASRKGDFVEIVQQVRWELDVRGYEEVEIFVSGGIDEEAIPALVEAGVGGFGVGTSVANAPTVDFSLDLVEVEGRPAAKRGKYSGRKDVLRCPEDLTYEVDGTKTLCPECGTPLERVLAPFLEKGKEVGQVPPPTVLRQVVLEQLGRVSFSSHTAGQTS